MFLLFLFLNFNFNANGEWGVENGELGIGSWEWGVGNGELGMGSGSFQIIDVEMSSTVTAIVFLVTRNQ
jgi:hypothetical protein